MHQKVLSSIKHSKGERDLCQNIDRIFEDQTSKLGFSSEQPHPGSVPDALVVPQPLPVSGQHPTNAASSTVLSQPVFTSPTFRDSYPQTVNNPVGSHQGRNPYLPLPERYNFNSYSDSLDAFGSGADSNSSFQFDGSGILTMDTTLSGYNLTDNEQGGSMDSSGSQLSFLQQTAGLASQALIYPHRNRDISYNQRTPSFMDHNNSMSGYAGPSVPYGHQQQHVTTTMRFRQTNTAQVAEPLPSRGNDEQVMANNPSWAHEHDHEPTSEV